MKTLNRILIGIILLFLLFTVKYCSNQPNYQTPKGLITNEQANALEETYKANQYGFINERLSANGNVKDHREIWFSMEEIENYIHYVKTQSKEKEYKNLGLRVYFGAKADENGIIKSTVFFAPTNKEVIRGTSLNINSNGINALNFGSAGDPASEFSMP